MEIYALGLTIIVGLIWLAVRVSKNSGYTEAQFDEAQAMIDEVERINREAKQNEKTTSNLSRDELRSRLSK